MPIEVPSGDDLKTGRSIQQFATWRWVAIAKSLERERTDQNSSAARLASVSQSGKCGSGIEKAIGGRALRHRIAPDIRDPQAVYVRRWPASASGYCLHRPSSLT
jgi:hypothetical protein